MNNNIGIKSQFWFKFWCDLSSRSIAHVLSMLLKRVEYHVVIKVDSIPKICTKC